MEFRNTLEDGKPFTRGVIARRASVGVHLAQDEIHRRRIEPIGRAGTLRVFSEDQAEQIVRAILGRREQSR